MKTPQPPFTSSEVTLREDAPASPTTTAGSEATLIETAASTGPATVTLATGFEIDGWQLREAIKVTSGEADLWVAAGKQKGKTAVVKVFRWGLHPKPELVAKLSKVSRAQVVEVYGRGVLPDGRHYEILEHIQHGTLADLGKGKLPPARAKAVLKELADAVEALHEVGILHRDLKPSNVLVRRVKPLDLVLTDFGISSLAELSLHATSAHRTAAYSAPEAMTGVVSRASDWWSLGIIVLELLQAKHPFAGLDERAINFQLVTRGIEVPPDLPPDWALLIKGLLTRDHAKRWGAEQVQAWLEGKRDLAVHYGVPAMAGTSHKPYRFSEQEYSDAASLAAALAEHWEDGVKHWGRGYVLKWVEKDLSDQDLASQLQDVRDDAELKTPELQLAVAVLVINPELPLSWHGEVVNRGWLASNSSEAKSILESGVPDWLVRLRKDTTLKQLRQRSQRANQVLKKFGISLDETQTMAAALAEDEALLKLGAKAQREYHTSNDKKLAKLVAKPDLAWEEALVLALASPDLFVCRSDQAKDRLKQYKERLDDALEHEDIQGRRAVIQDLTAETQDQLVELFGEAQVPKRILDQLTNASEKALRAVEDRMAAQQKVMAAELKAQVESCLLRLEKEASLVVFPVTRARLQAKRQELVETAAKTLRRWRQVYDMEVPSALLTRFNKASQRAGELVEALLSEHEAAEQEVKAVLPRRLLEAYDQAQQRLHEIKQRFSDIDCSHLEQSLQKLSERVQSFETKAVAISFPVNLKWIQDQQADIKLSATDCRNRLRELFGKNNVPQTLLARCDEAERKVSAQLEALIKQREEMAREVGSQLVSRVQDGRDFDAVRLRMEEIRKLFSDIDWSQLEGLLAKLDSPEQQLIRRGLAHVRAQDMPFDEMQAKTLLAKNDWKFLQKEFDGRIARLRALIPNTGAAPNASNNAPIMQSGRWRRMKCDAEWQYWDAVALVAFDSRVFLTSSEVARAPRARAFKTSAYGIICLCLAIAISTKVYQRLQTRKASSEYTLGLTYENGTGVKQDNFEALKLYRKAAELGHAEAQFKLGRSYFSGIGLDTNLTEGVKWFRKAAEQGNAKAQCSLASAYSHGQGVETNDTEAVNWYRKAAEAGYAEAQCSLGGAYFRGMGVETNYTEGAKWFRKAAEQGDARAQCNLASAYYYGQGVETDHNEALGWYRKAAEAGYADGQYSVGCYYQTGEGVEKSDTEAVKWYRKAAEQGNANAQGQLGVCYERGQGVETNQTEALECYRKAAEQGHVLSMLTLALGYKTGNHGLAKDDSESAKWFQRAAESGDASAQDIIGSLYATGSGVKQDDAAALKWFSLAADQGYAAAQFSVGLCYYNGKGVAKDIKTALVYLILAAASDQASAKTLLAESTGSNSRVQDVVKQLREKRTELSVESQKQFVKSAMKDWTINTSL